MQNQIDQLVADVAPRVQDYRHRIHQHPELGMQEFETSRLVQEQLTRIGIPFRAGVAVTGVVGLIEGALPGPCIALRADMDALPLQDTCGQPWASTVPGVCHACGHDVHTSMLLGAAEVLWQLRGKIAGQVKLLFQPAEECNPTGGMPAMIADGILENPTLQAAIGMHVDPSLPTGSIAYRIGAMSASSNRFFITIKGKAAHGSAPENGADAIVAAAQVIMGVQAIVSRRIRALESAVLTIGTIHGGDRYNVIAESVQLEGTCRTHNPTVTAAIPRMLEQMIAGICSSMGCSYDFRFENGYPSLVCNERISELAAAGLRQAMGDERVVRLTEPRMGGEDFSFLAQRVPATFLRLGCTPPGVQKPAPTHNGAFDPDENCFAVGVRGMVTSALAVLQGLA